MPLLFDDVIVRVVLMTRAFGSLCSKEEASLIRNSFLTLHFSSLTLNRNQCQCFLRKRKEKNVISKRNDMKI